MQAAPPPAHAYTVTAEVPREPWSDEPGFLERITAADRPVILTNSPVSTQQVTLKEEEEERRKKQEGGKAAAEEQGNRKECLVLFFIVVLF